MDPLAIILSSVASTKINEKDAIDALDLLLNNLNKISKRNVYLPWIDQNKETIDFINFWYCHKQIEQLRKLSYLLNNNKFKIPLKIKNVISIAISRLIISKEPKATLARDTAHSRPHKVISENEFDIVNSLPKSLKYVLKSIDSNGILVNSKTYLGDARKLTKINKNEIDAIITSPPYINAIDYMRGHKLSLIWFGYTINELRNIRSNSIGSEKKCDLELSDDFIRIKNELNLQFTDRQTSLLVQKYYKDLVSLLSECYRVLKSGSAASFVVANSIIKKQPVPTNNLLVNAATLAGFYVDSDESREIQTNKRYLPIFKKNENNIITNRMHKEYIITFRKK